MYLEFFFCNYGKESEKVEERGRNTWAEMKEDENIPQSRMKYVHKYSIYTYLVLAIFWYGQWTMNIEHAHKSLILINGHSDGWWCESENKY